MNPPDPVEQPTNPDISREYKVNPLIKGYLDTYSVHTNDSDKDAHNEEVRGNLEATIKTIQDLIKAEVTWRTERVQGGLNFPGFLEQLKHETDCLKLLEQRVNNGRMDERKELRVALAFVACFALDPGYFDRNFLSREFVDPNNAEQMRQAGEKLTKGKKAARELSAIFGFAAPYEDIKKFFSRMVDPEYYEQKEQNARRAVEDKVLGIV